jgi:hypothetical protein
MVSCKRLDGLFVLVTMLSMFFSLERFISTDISDVMRMDRGLEPCSTRYWNKDDRTVLLAARHQDR